MYKPKKSHQKFLYVNFYFITKKGQRRNFAKFLDNWTLFS